MTVNVDVAEEGALEVAVVVVKATVVDVAVKMAVATVVAVADVHHLVVIEPLFATK